MFFSKEPNETKGKLSSPLSSSSKFLERCLSLRASITEPESYKLLALTLKFYFLRKTSLPGQSESVSDTDLKTEIEKLRVENNKLRSLVAERDSRIERYKTELLAIHQELKTLVDSVNAQAKIFKDLQKRVNPTEYPRVQGFEFSSKYHIGQKSGGDYFDVFVSTDRLRFAVVVAASSSYTVSSLFLSILLKYHNRVFDGRLLSAPEFCEFLESEFSGQMLTNDKVHLFYALIDQRRYEMNSVLFGDVLGVKDSVRGREDLGSSLPPITQDLDWKSQSLHYQKTEIEKGDRFILATPGILNQQNQNGIAFGSAGVMRALGRKTDSLMDLRDEILTDWVQHKGLEQHPEQDSSLFLFSLRANAIKLA